MNHLTMKQLLEYADGMKNDIVLSHLSGCPECRAKLKSLTALDHKIRSLPPEHPSEEFVRRVMRRVGVRESSSLVWTIVRNLAPLVALTAVTGIVFVVLNLTGVLGSSDIGDSVSVTGKIAGSFSRSVHAGVTSVTAWVQKFLPSGRSGSSSTTVLFLLVVFVGVALLDRLIFNPLWRRRTGQGSALQQ